MNNQGNRQLALASLLDILLEICSYRFGPTTTLLSLTVNFKAIRLCFEKIERARIPVNLLGHVPGFLPVKRLLSVMSLEDYLVECRLHNRVITPPYSCVDLLGELSACIGLHQFLIDRFNEYSASDRSQEFLNSGVCWLKVGSNRHEKPLMKDFSTGV